MKRHSKREAKVWIILLWLIKEKIEVQVQMINTIKRNNHLFYLK